MNSLDSLLKTDSETPDFSELEDSLARKVRQDFSDADNYRRSSGVEERLLKALRARRCEYDPEDKALINGINIYLGVTALKSRAGTSWINDILLNSIDKPWTLTHTPIPDLPVWLRDQVVDALEMELEQIGLSGNIRERAKELKSVAMKYVNQKAQDASARMEQKIDDQLTEGGWRVEFAKFIDDLCTFPTAFMRSPVIQKQRRLEWDGKKLQEIEKTIYVSRRISPFDAFPSMDAENPSTSRYFIERMSISPDQLHLMLGVEGFNDETIRYIIDRYGDTGYKERLSPDNERKRLEDKQVETREKNNTIDVLVYNGKLSGHLLIENNVLVDDPQKYYEVEAWTVANMTVKAVLNPYPLSARPIFSTSFVKVPGSIWGEGLRDILDSVQRMANSAARSIARNMSYSSGPITEVDVSRLVEGEAPDEIIPYRVYHVDSDPMGSGKPAFTFNTVPHIAPQLEQIMNRFIVMADDLSGIPAYVLGNPQVSGAGRTMGGLQMMMGNAAKGIKNVILNVDRDVIENIITFYYNMNMLYDDDEDIKGDAQVVARGATGLLQREMASSKATELLQVMLPYQQYFKPSGIQRMLREVVKLAGWPVDDIIDDPDRLMQLQQALGGAMTNQALQNGTSMPMPPLDGRSAPTPFPQQSIPPQMMNSPGPTNLPQGAL